LAGFFFISRLWLICCEKKTLFISRTDKHSRTGDAVTEASRRLAERAGFCGRPRHGVAVRRAEDARKRFSPHCVSYAWHASHEDDEMGSCLPGTTPQPSDPKLPGRVCLVGENI
jgi:hypothetical protein